MEETIALCPPAPPLLFLPFFFYEEAFLFFFSFLTGGKRGSGIKGMAGMLEKTLPPPPFLRFSPLLLSLVDPATPGERGRRM